MQVAYGRAMTEFQRTGSGYPVAVLVVSFGAAGETEAAARILFLSVREGRIRLRFQLEADAELHAASFDATFVAESGSRPLFETVAECSVDSEYRIEVEVPLHLEQEWSRLRVTDRMPFRLMLRPRPESGNVTQT